MKPEAINQAIAEWSGWVKFFEPDRVIEGVGRWMWHKGNKNLKQVPDFYHDLNAVHEAVCSLSNTEMREFSTRAVDMALRKGTSVFRLDAPDWCECLARTLGLWRDE